MRGPIAGGTAALVVLLLAGCSAGGWLPHERSGTARDRAALAHAWSTPAAQPGWIPADASAIQWIAATTGGADRAPAAVRLTSGAAPAVHCSTLDQPGSAAITAAWTPSGPATAVLRCGDWAVQRIDGGYYGWTPVDPVATG